jgi:hypothetical protein
VLPPPAQRSKLRLLTQRAYPKTGTVMLEYEIVRGKNPASRRVSRTRA